MTSRGLGFPAVQILHNPNQTIVDFGSKQFASRLALDGRPPTAFD